MLTAPLNAEFVCATSLQANGVPMMNVTSEASLTVSQMAERSLDENSESIALSYFACGEKP